MLAYSFFTSISISQLYVIKKEALQDEKHRFGAANLAFLSALNALFSLSLSVSQSGRQAGSSSKYQLSYSSDDHVKVDRLIFSLNNTVVVRLDKTYTQSVACLPSGHKSLRQCLMGIASVATG